MSPLATDRAMCSGFHRGLCVNREGGHIDGAGDARGPIECPPFAARGVLPRWAVATVEQWRCLARPRVLWVRGLQMARTSHCLSRTAASALL
eukprot:6123645-Alexandrium_andersonii.AAC.1